MILIQKSKGCSAFDEQKVKNIAIEYRLQLVFSNPGRTQDSAGEHNEGHLNVMYPTPAEPCFFLTKCGFIAVIVERSSVHGGRAALREVLDLILVAALHVTCN